MSTDLVQCGVCVQPCELVRPASSVLGGVSAGMPHLNPSKCQGPHVRAFTMSSVRRREGNPCAPTSVWNACTSECGKPRDGQTNVSGCWAATSANGVRVGNVCPHQVNMRREVQSRGRQGCAARGGTRTGDPGGACGKPAGVEAVQSVVRRNVYLGESERKSRRCPSARNATREVRA